MGVSCMHKANCTFSNKQHENKSGSQQNRTKNRATEISGMLFLKILHFAEKKGVTNLWILCGKPAKNFPKSVENSMDLHRGS